MSDEYVALFSEYDTSIINVLKAEGKSTMVKQLQAGQITIENMIMSEDYYATLLDFWILSRRFDIPLIFYSGTKLLENNLPILVAMAEGKSMNEFYFIKVPGSRPNVVPKFRLLVSGSPPTALIDTTLLSVGLRRDISKQLVDTSVETFLRNYKKPKVKKRKKLKLVKKVDKAEKPAGEKKKRGRPRKLKKKLKLKVAEKGN